MEPRTAHGYIALLSRETGAISLSFEIGKNAIPVYTYYKSEKPA